MALINISITSDPVCPWCYIGYRRLTKAIRLYQKTYPGGGRDTVRVSWKLYILDANAPTESIPYMERMTQKLGADKVAGTQAHLQRLGRADGIHFRFGGRIGSTIRAHQMIMLSELQDQKSGDDTRAGTAGVVEAIFRAHFEEEQDITDPETLIRLAVQAGSGLEESQVRSWLEEGQGVAEIQSEAQRARDEGIQGVPHFQIGEGKGMRTLSGGQDASDFLQALIAYKEGLGGTTEDSASRQVSIENAC
ncbi:DsbA family oxidoreductase [Aspergillus homomorphus CBS 101889]|uniref:DSBA-like thioredoxin domain-containing protein n=1 Tax=Aspergillus homomorphus (strain CBS 101889) TaxID=1450537 RepID=A0A395HQU1_ASPHC|nr:DSBA-like thioredoxin domain-containing protein [Aspergillus homomorphus CBS 101889]RAL10187.1 DSBA-like thioredoxin domain-containing protein [Aspergillus homomorphus CBS 101889]